MLIDSTTPGFGIDPWLIGVVTLTSVGLLSLVLAIAIKAQRKIATTGHQELLTATPEVLSWSKGKGEVRVTGEVWQAQSAEEFIIKKGDTVQVIAVDGLRLVVAPLNNNEEKKS